MEISETFFFISQSNDQLLENVHVLLRTYYEGHELNLSQAKVLDMIFEYSG